MTASRRRAMKVLGRVTFYPDTTSGAGSPQASLRRRVSLQRKIVLLNMKRKRGKISEKCPKNTYLRKTQNRHKTQKVKK